MELSRSGYAGRLVNIRGRFNRPNDSQSPGRPRTCPADSYSHDADFHRIDSFVFDDAQSRKYRLISVW